MIQNFRNHAKENHKMIKFKNQQKKLKQNKQKNRHATIKRRKNISYGIN